jgi:N utilization substance protein B
MFLYDVPFKVVINEGVNMAKGYGAQDSHKFINSVLDRIARDVRGMECDEE